MIRKAVPDDAPAIQALIDQYVPSGTLLPRPLDFILTHIEHYLVFERDGVLAGCVHLEEYSPSLAEIRSVAVDARFHGQGIGPALVEEAERLARIRQCSTVFAVSDREEFFTGLGYELRYIPELDQERSEVSKFKGVFAKDV